MKREGDWGGAAPCLGPPRTLLPFLQASRSVKGAVCVPVKPSPLQNTHIDTDRGREIDYSSAQTGILTHYKRQKHKAVTVNKERKSSRGDREFWPETSTTGRGRHPPHPLPHTPTTPPPHTPQAAGLVTSLAAASWLLDCMWAVILYNIYCREGQISCCLYMYIFKYWLCDIIFAWLKMGI